MTPEELAAIRDRKVPLGPGAVWTLTEDRDALLAEVEEAGKAIRAYHEANTNALDRAEKAEAAVERLTESLTGHARVLTVARSALAQADQHCPDADDHGPEVAHLCEACTQADTVRTALGAIDHLLKGRVA